MEAKSLLLDSSNVSHIERITREMDGYLQLIDTINKGLISYRDRFVQLKNEAVQEMRDEFLEDQKKKAE